MAAFGRRERQAEDYQGHCARPVSSLLSAQLPADVRRARARNDQALRLPLKVCECALRREPKTGREHQSPIDFLAMNPAADA